MLNFRPHEYALLFPAMSGQEYADLKASIAENGLIDDIVLYEGEILEGVHRYKACKELGVEARFVNWVDCAESLKKIGLLAYVVAKNLPRRHLSTEQRVKLALELLPKLKKEAQERQAATQFKDGGERLASNDTHRKGRATEIAAKMVGVSTSTVERAARAERDESDGEAATEQPPEPELVSEVFTLLRKAKATIKAFPANVSIEVVGRLARWVDNIRATVYGLREPDKGEPMTDDSICPFGKHKGEPMRKVPNDWLRWWLEKNPNRAEIELQAATLDPKQRAIALRSLKFWDYATERLKKR